MKKDDPEGLSPFGLQEVFDTMEKLSGLEVSIYPPDAKQASPSIDRLPISYRRHMSAFCRAVKNTRDGRGCGGHDSTYTNRKAATVRTPFVQRCRAGVAEVIVPVFAGDEHLATVFIGQAVTEEVAVEGFHGVWQRVSQQCADRNALREGFDALPRMTAKQLLQVGRLADTAIRGLNEQMSTEMFAQEVRLQNAPAIRMAVDILQQERCWDIPQTELAERVHLSSTHFCRLFHEVMGKTFKAYVTELRICRAQLLLHQTSCPIADIAARCGYSRQSYFTRRFREVTGMTPSAYRGKRQDQSG